MGRDAWCMIRDALATLCAKPDLPVALPAMVASSGEARLTGAFETNRDQGKRDPTRHAPSNEKSGNDCGNYLQKLKYPPQMERLYFS